MRTLKENYTAAAKDEMKAGARKPMVRENGGGDIVIDKSAWKAMLVIVPLLFSLFGFGVSQLVFFAKVEARVANNEALIEELRDWGPRDGDRYSAADATADRRVHEAVHIALLAEFTEVKVRLAAIEQAIKK